MSVPPVNAEGAIASAIYSAIAPLMTAYQFAGNARCFYQVAPEQVPMPFVVFQLQSDIEPVQRVGGWEGNATVVLRAIAATPAEARSMLGLVASGMDNLTISGHHVKAVWDGALSIPPQIGYAQSALRYDVRVRKL
jgi:hypothetical protein